MDEEREEKRGKAAAVKKMLSPKAVLAIAIVVAVVAVGLGIWFGKSFFTESTPTKLGFEDIGELATQAAYCTEVNVTEGSRDLFGVTIPFTQSKYVYSYNVVVKAGFDFEKIHVQEDGDTLTVHMPEAKILSSEVDTDSFQVYVEQESIFRPITLEENNQALASLKENAEQTAVANGLLDNAKSNAEVILTAFLAGQYDMEKYTVNFVYGE